MRPCEADSPRGRRHDAGRWAVPASPAGERASCRVGLLAALVLGACVPPGSDVKDHIPPADSGADSGDTGDSGTPDSADTSDSGVPDRLRVAVPAYVEPGSAEWSGFSAGAGSGGGLVILNPNSGPGSTRSDAWAAAVDSAHASGALVLGYVATGYMGRDPDEIDGDVIQYTTWYGVDGIFFDEVSGPETCDLAVSWYGVRAANAHAKLPAGGLVALNPGLISCEAYLDSADIVVVAEDDWKVVNQFAPESWMTNYAPSRFWFLAYDVPPSSLGMAVASVRSWNLGWVFLTDDLLPNPWDELPTFWDEEVAAVAVE